MQIFINNQLAALKQGTSFDYVSENRLFSGSDGYSLTITFPLKDCPQNQSIFGHINRAVVTVSGDKGIAKAQEEYERLIKNKSPKNKR